MSIFDKLFKKSSNSDDRERSARDRSKYMPEEKLPLDEQFIHHFTKQGGRFLYALDEGEVLAHFEDILVEHDFFESQVCVLNNSLGKRFNGFNLEYQKSPLDTTFFLTNCEYVIADNGAILFSSHQIKELKPAELPSTFVVIASTSQIVETIGEGLRGIKYHNSDKIPTNITTLKNFQEQVNAVQEKDLMNYGVPHKRLYLILLEDL